MDRARFYQELKISACDLLPKDIVFLSNTDDVPSIQPKRPPDELLFVVSTHLTSATRPRWSVQFHDGSHRFFYADTTVQILRPV